MKIVMDLQGAQSESRYRGIGRYSLSLAEAVARRARGHDIHIALNGAFVDTIQPIRSQFIDLVPRQNVHVWHVPLPVIAKDHANDARRAAAEIVREAALDALDADVIHVSSVFEGYVDNSVTSVPEVRRTPTLVTLYDMIPLMNPGTYLDPDPDYRNAYMEKVAHIQRADAVVAISASSAEEARRIAGLPADRVFEISTGCDAIFRPLAGSDPARSQVREKFGIAGEFVLYTGGSDERKNLVRLVQAYAALPAELRRGIPLVFAGRTHAPHVAQLCELGEELGLPEGSLHFTGYVTDAELVALYNECLLFVFASWHEGFGLPVLEAMACGAAVLASDASSIKEIATERSALFDPLDVDSIKHTLAHFLGNRDALLPLKQYSLQRAQAFSWDLVADRFLDACEVIGRRREASVETDSVVSAAVDVLKKLGPLDPILSLQLADAIDRSVAPATRMLMVDVTELANHDLLTGIQRVTRAVIAEWGAHPPHEYRLQLVRIDRESRQYVCANRYAAAFFGTSRAEDSPLVCHAGDVFVGLDLVGDAVSFVPEWFEYFRATGVMVSFVIYDILPIRHPEWWPEGGAWHHERWLRDVISVSDQVVCISRAVAEDVEAWTQEQGCVAVPEIAWFHLGADLDASGSSGIPDSEALLLKRLELAPAFLMVGTVEPRKGHLQVLRAFEHLWASGREATLVIVGKRGWMVDELCHRMETHEQLGRSLFWLSKASDELLEQLYARSTCLIAGSEGEGFGLPIIEAGQRGLPVIARDIPVFREVAGDHAFYFSQTGPDGLAREIDAWLELHEHGMHPRADGLPWLTWAQSAERLKKLVLAGADRVEPAPDSPLGEPDGRSGRL